MNYISDIKHRRAVFVNVIRIEFANQSSSNHVMQQQTTSLQHTHAESIHTIQDIMRTSLVMTSSSELKTCHGLPYCQLDYLGTGSIQFK